MVYVLMKFSKNSYKSLIRVFSTLNLQLCAWNMFRIQIFYQFYLFFNEEFMVCIEKKQKKPFTYGQIICSPLHPICKVFITYKIINDHKYIFCWQWSLSNLILQYQKLIYFSSWCYILYSVINSRCIIISFV